MRSGQNPAAVRVVRQAQRDLRGISVSGEIDSAGPHRHRRLAPAGGSACDSSNVGKSPACRTLAPHGSNLDFHRSATRAGSLHRSVSHSFLPEGLLVPQASDHQCSDSETRLVNLDGRGYRRFRGLHRSQHLLEFSLVGQNQGIHGGNFHQHCAKFIGAVQCRRSMR
jgi:hypothetical protein